MTEDTNSHTKNSNTTQQSASEFNNSTTQPKDSTQDSPQEAKETLEQLRAKYFTALADIENLRKRHAREREEIVRYSSANIISSILPVVDNFQTALEAAQKHHPEAKTILDGFGMIVPQLVQSLTAAGVTVVAPKAGDVFDPHSHESVGEAPSDKIPHHAILSLQRPGYRLQDRLLRPAMVILSSGAQK
jgi:molecular chaperone GrpE